MKENNKSDSKPAAIQYCLLEDCSKLTGPQMAVLGRFMKSIEQWKITTRR